MSNESGLRPMEYNVVVRMDPPKEKIGNIFIPTTAKDREELATDEGTLEAVSPHAFTYAEWPAEATPPQPGQRVMFAQYAGRIWKPKGENGPVFRILKDKDIVAVIERPAELTAAA